MQNKSLGLFDEIEITLLIEVNQPCLSYKENPDGTGNKYSIRSPLNLLVNDGLNSHVINQRAILNAWNNKQVFAITGNTTYDKINEFKDILKLKKIDFDDGFNKSVKNFGPVAKLEAQMKYVEKADWIVYELSQIKSVSIVFQFL